MEKREKTLFITSFYGFLGRNILGSGLLEILLSNPNLRVVVFLPNKKTESYRKFFPHPQIIFEGIDHNRNPGKLEKRFSYLFGFLSDVYYWRMERASLWRRGFRWHAAIFWLVSKLGHLKIVRRLVRHLDYILMPKNYYRKYFEKYSPDLGFTTDIFRSQDIYLMREARFRKVPILGMIRSWDNVTGKGLNQIIPDEVVAHNPVIKEEAIKYDDMKSEHIHLIGVPHYDRYVTERRSSRAELFKKLNLDPNKKMVLISPPIWTYTHDPLAPFLVKALEPLDVQVVVRLHMMSKSNMADLRPIPNKLAINAPDQITDVVNADITTQDDFFADLLYHSDVVVSHASTLGIDAAVFDKPAIYIGFDVKPKPYYASLRWLHDTEFLKRLRQTGGIRLAENVDQFLEYVKKYLADPKLDREGRQNIVRDYCWKLDAQSSQRLADVILSMLNLSS